MRLGASSLILLFNLLSLSVVGLFAGLDAGGERVWVGVLVWPFGVALAFSWASALVGIVLGARAWWRGQRRGWSLFGTLGNAVYFIAAMWVLKILWPALMGI